MGPKWYHRNVSETPETPETPEASLPLPMTAERDYRPAIAAAVLALIIYAITLGGTYVYDDRYIILTDPRVSDVGRWGQYWTKDYFNGGADNLYRPLTSMSYAIQAKLHGIGENRAWAFHLVNVLAHAAASALVAELARRLTRSTPIALVAGLLFAAHPIHVEAVANIVGRAELMCGAGMFAALVLFLKPLTTSRAIVIWLCLVFAMLSKEQGLLLPPLLVLLIPLRSITAATRSSPGGDHIAGEPGSAATQALAYASPQTPHARRPRAGLLLTLLILWTMALYIGFREHILKFWWDRSFLDPVINPLVESTGVDRCLVPVAMLGRYVALLIAPIRLLPDYGGDVIGSHASLGDPYFILGVIAMIAWLIAFVLAVRRRKHAIVFCLLSATLLYGMVANVLTLIGTNFAERLMYIPSAFVCILAAIAVMKLRRPIGLVAACCIVVLFSARSLSYAERWNDPVALFERGLAEQPKSIRLSILLAEEWERRGELDRARQVMRSARETMPDYYRLWLVSARIELEAGNFATARAFTRHAQQINPTPGGEMMLSEIHSRESAAAAATRPSRPATSP